MTAALVRENQDIHIFGVMSADISAAKPILKPFLDRAIKKRKVEHQETADAILSRCSQQDAQCWTVFCGSDLVAVLVTEIITYPTGLKTMRIQWISGKYFNLWREDAESLFIRFAKQFGCDTLEASGRAGWSRKYPELVRSVVFNYEMRLK